MALSLQPSLCTYLQAAADGLSKQGPGMPVVDQSTITRIQPPPDALSSAVSAASASAGASSRGVMNNVRPSSGNNQLNVPQEPSHMMLPMMMSARGSNETDVASQIALVDSAFAKLHSDLAATRGVIARSAQLLVSGSLFRSNSGSNSSSNAQSIVDNVDFLGQLPPRLGALIEAGVGGVLDEDLFEECLAVNDAVARIIEVAVPLVDEIEAQANAFGSTTFSLLPPPVREFPALSDLVSFESKPVQVKKVVKEKQDTDLLTLNPTSTVSPGQTKDATSLSDDLMGLSFPPLVAAAAASGGGAGAQTVTDNRRRLDPIEFDPSPFDAASSSSTSTTTATASATNTSSSSTRNLSQVNGGIDF